MPPGGTCRATSRDRGYDADRLRSALRAVRLDGVFRVIHRSHRTTPLAAVPTPSRFSDPEARYAVLYAADSVRCAFWETLGRNRFVRRRQRAMPRSEVEARLVVSIHSEGDLLLVDLRGDGPVRVVRQPRWRTMATMPLAVPCRPLPMAACPRRTDSCSRRGLPVTCAWPCSTAPSVDCWSPTRQSLFATRTSWTPSTSTTSC